MAGGNKRRLSRGGSAGPLLGKTYDSEEDSDVDMMDQDDEDDDVAQPAMVRGRSASGSNGRRRSSFGGARFENAEEQERVVGMYTNIIKLSSENKINDKNSWNLDLIDNMGKLIKNDSREHRGVNFQKASCTLDASVKIYSHRVDDTYSTSHRVLESFSRNKLEDEEEEEENEDENGVQKPKKASRVGSRKRSGAANTIEKNIDNINAKEIENEAKIDPVFQTMSKLFDKGGVHGMLLYNLRCINHTPGMALSTEGLPDPLSVAASVATSSTLATAEATVGFMEEEGLTLAEARARIMGDAPRAKAVAPTEEETCALETVEEEKGEETSAGAGASASVTPFQTEGEGETAPAPAPISEVEAGSNISIGELAQEQEQGECIADLVDITAWTTEIALSPSQLKELSCAGLCGQLDAWREACGVVGVQAGMVDPRDFTCLAAPSHPGTSTATTTTDSDAMHVEEQEEPTGSTTTTTAISSVVEVAKAKSAMKSGFYDHTCIPFTAWSDTVRSSARTRRDMAIMSASSSSSSSSGSGSALYSAYDGRSGGSTSGTGAATGPSPDDPATTPLESMTISDGNDDDGDDGDDGFPCVDEAEADDCDDEGNYISSARRASLDMMALPLPPVSSTDRDINNDVNNTNDHMQRPLSLSPLKGESKIKWAAVNGDMEISEEQVHDHTCLAEDEAVVEGMIDGLAAQAGAVACGGAIATAAEYAFFDVESVSKNTHWAGARHWRWGSTRAAASRAAAAAAAVGEEEEADARNNCDSEDQTEAEFSGALKKDAAIQSKGKSKNNNKKGDGLDFSECLHPSQWSKESAFGAPKGRGDTTCMTSAAMSKALEEAEEGGLFLPKDDKVEAKDLCRLLTLSHVVVPPILLKDLVIPAGGKKTGRFARIPGSSGSGGSSDSNGKAKDDFVWTVSASDSGADAAKDDDDAAGDMGIGDDDCNDDDDDGGGGGGDDIDYDDDRYFAPGGTEDAPEAAQIAAELRESLGSTAPDNEDSNSSSNDAGIMEKGGSVFDIDQSKLIQLERKVEKIQIGYSVIPKKVNVKQLKVDIWDQVATLTGVERDEEGGHKKKKKNGDKENESEGADVDDDDDEPPPQDYHATQSSKQLSKTTDTSMSFQALVNTVASGQKQKEVTLSFYFICLLHLANEKTLCLTDDKESLDELTISSDLQV